MCLEGSTRNARGSSGIPPWLALVLVLFVIARAHAANDTSPASPPLQIALLEDTEGELSIEEVSVASAENRFVTADREALNIGFTK